MAQSISAARAKAQLSALLGAVFFRGERYLIERRGRPVAALVSVDEFERLERASTAGEDFQRFLPRLVAWADIADQDIDAFVSDIYAARDADTGRPVDLGA